MQRRALLSSCLALGAPAVLGALLVGTTLLSPGSPGFGSLVSAPPAPGSIASAPSNSSQPVIPRQAADHPEPVPPVLPAPGGAPVAVGVGVPLRINPEPPGLPAPAAAPASPASDDRFARAEQLRADGEVASAVALLDRIRSTAEPPLAAQAQFQIARAYLLDGDATSGVSALRAYLQTYPDQPDAPDARLALATELTAAGQGAAAQPLYQQYLAQTTDHTLDGYAWLALARDLDQHGDPAALDDYRQAVAAGLPAPDELDAATKVAAGFVRAGDVSDAVDWYVGLADRYPANDPVRADYLVRAADCAARNGGRDRATALVGELTASGAVSGKAVDELLNLRSLGVSIDDIALGTAFLKAGNNVAAVSAFGDYLDRYPDGASAATARFGRGQALLGAGDYSSAVAQLQKFLDTSPGDPRVGDAKTLLARAQAASSNQSDGAATASATSGPQVAFAQGWTAYEALDFSTARADWTSVLQHAPNDPASPAALLWLAKLDLKAGNTASALRELRQAWSANPGDYYAFRARELATTLGGSAAPTFGATSDPSRERATFENWLALWTHAPSDASEHPYLDAAITHTSTLDRIRALESLGLRDQVGGEYQAAIDLYWSDGRSLYALADTLAQLGLDPQSMKVAYDLLMMSPAPNAYQAPTYLQRLVYPFPYRDLVETAARKYGVDPLLLVALIRQESSFDPRANSSAGARGLTQFMPSTAATLAPSVGLNNFGSDDLYRPSVAIPLGAAYLADLTREFGGNPYLALAAYNAGSGNVRSWLGDNPRDDFDLLAEEIPFQETRSYVRNVYRFYQEYISLYPGSIGNE